MLAQRLCPACGRPQPDRGRTWHVETPRGTNPWARCSSCSAYFLVGSYVLDDEVAHTETLPWGQLQAGLELNAFKQRMFTAALRHLTRHRPPPARILDVGCSFGGFSIAANTTGYDVTGMDITPAAVDYLASLGLAAECCSTAADLRTVAPASLDAVTCFDCHSLWPDQPSQLQAIRAKLTPGGYLLMRVIDKSWMFTIGRCLAPLSPRLANRVMREAVNDSRFSMPLHTLRDLLDEQGFDIVSTSIRTAVHSYSTRWPAKASFWLGAALWPLIHRNVAPGALIVATRRT